MNNKFKIGTILKTKHDNIVAFEIPFSSIFDLNQKFHNHKEDIVEFIVLPENTKIFVYYHYVHHSTNIMNNEDYIVLYFLHGSCLLRSYIYDSFESFQNDFEIILL